MNPPGVKEGKKKEMFKRIFRKSNTPSLKEEKPKKDIVVRIVRPSSKPKAPITDNEVERAKEYEDEVKTGNYINLAQGLSVGAGVGILICALAAVIGLNLSFRDMAAIIGVPAVLGVIAGYIFS